MYEDGGLSSSTPTDIEIVEGKTIWQARTAFDLILSLGTGETLDGRSDASNRDSSTNILARLLTWSQARLSEAISSEEVHRRVTKMLGNADAHAYVRLNHKLPGDLPRLDDAKSMNRLLDMVDELSLGSSLARVRKMLVASSFFFELKKPPTYCGSDGYQCEGTIRIRGDPNLVLELLDAFKNDRMQFIRNGKVLCEDVHSGGMCHHCRRFSQPVQFYVNDLDASETISLKFSEGN